MIQPEINRTFTPRDIAKFVIDNDKEDIFKSAKLNFDEFVSAVGRMDAVNQIIVFKNGEELCGTLGWFFITDENKHLVGKHEWRIPEDLVHGDILYLSFIATKGDCDVLAIKKMFEEMGYRKRITRRRGFTKGKWYEHRIFKGDGND